MSDKFDEMGLEIARESAAHGYPMPRALASWVAALVRREVEQARADEREACAKMVDLLPNRFGTDSHTRRDVLHAAKNVAAAIRARGEQHGTGETEGR